jgi:hypothetical protein
MMHKQLQKWLGLTLLAALWIGIVLTTAPVVRQFSMLLALPQDQSSESADTLSTIVKYALTSTITSREVIFKPDADSPFRETGVSAQTATTGTVQFRPIRQPEVLVLKGFLEKEKPLAIIEDSRGETFILGVGDSLYGQKILSIQPDRVKVRDGVRVYEIGDGS